MVKFLLIENDDSFSTLINTLLKENFDCQVIRSNSIDDASILLENNECSFDLIIIDLDLNGLSSLKTLVNCCTPIPIIALISNIENEENSPIYFGAQDFILKPNINFQTLSHVVIHSIERHKVRSIFTPLK